MYFSYLGEVEVTAETSEDKEEGTDQVFVAFARVFSGCVRKGQKLYVLGPKHDPAITLQKVSLFFIWQNCSVYKKPWGMFYNKP